MACPANECADRWLHIKRRHLSGAAALAGICSPAAPAQPPQPSRPQCMMVYEVKLALGITKLPALLHNIQHWKRSHAQGVMRWVTPGRGCYYPWTEGCDPAQIQGQIQCTARAMYFSVTNPAERRQKHAQGHACTHMPHTQRGQGAGQTASMPPKKTHQSKPGCKQTTPAPILAALITVGLGILRAWGPGAMHCSNAPGHRTAQRHAHLLGITACSRLHASSPPHLHPVPPSRSLPLWAAARRRACASRPSAAHSTCHLGEPHRPSYRGGPSHATLYMTAPLFPPPP